PAPPRSRRAGLPGAPDHHEPRRLPVGAGGVSPRVEVRERLPRAGRAPAEVPGRAGDGVGAAAPLRADDDRGEGALGLGRVSAPAAGERAGGGVPRAAGQAGGDGAVARGQRGAGARSSLTSAEAFTAGAVSGRAPRRRARALRPARAPGARGRRTTRRRSSTGRRLRRGRRREPRVPRRRATERRGGGTAARHHLPARPASPRAPRTRRRCPPPDVDPPAEESPAPPGIRSASLQGRSAPGPPPGARGPQPGPEPEPPWAPPRGPGPA